MARRKKHSTDALKIIHHKYFDGDPKRLAQLEEARASAAVARKLSELRTKAGLTQRELADLVGTKASVICRLEDDDYEGHSLSMLMRIACALDNRIEILFVPLEGKVKPV